jgi:DNA polymerase-4
MQIQAGTEAEFLSHQDIQMLPGMGPSLLRTASVVGMREIGEIASLTASQALSLFGKHGPMLRTMAQGIDGSPVEERSEAKRIIQRADFDECIIEGIGIKAAIETLVESGGLEMRRAKLGAFVIRVLVLYADGIEAEGQEKQKRMCVVDRDIYDAAERVYRKTAIRRVRVRSIGLSLEGLMPLGYEPDLFEPETDIKSLRLQEAVDRIQNRYGVGKIAMGRIIAANRMNNEKLPMRSTE